MRMKAILVVFVAACLFAGPFAVAANARDRQSGAPPVEQPLVREGDFAVELATALNLTRSHDEAAAERELITIGIAPQNGWISDYPMTPDILAEVRRSAARSASSGNLRISGTEAGGVVDKISTSMNLPIRAEGERDAHASRAEYPADSGATPPQAPEYLGSNAVEDFYNGNEPPVVTYYSPPWEYADQYEWVADPFWWGDFGFAGFYILADFDRHHHHHHITNHVVRSNGTVSRISPSARANTSGMRNFSSSAPARDVDRPLQNPGGITRGRDIDRSAGNSGLRSSPGALTPGSPPSSHFSTGEGYHGGGFGGGGMGGFHGGGGMGGMGGFHGGGGGHR